MSSIRFNLSKFDYSNTNRINFHCDWSIALR
ncbi:hypothetical protein T08_14117 [Trichinella sp. T8]|nr:hypothetical protein T08_14117 [Trichinella sp. T8]